MLETRDPSEEDSSSIQKKVLNRVGTADYGNNPDTNHVETVDGQKPTGRTSSKDEFGKNVGSGQSRGLRKTEEGGKTFTSAKDQPKSNPVNSLEKR